MFAGTRTDGGCSREDRNADVHLYRNQIMQSSIAPTVEEYESEHGGMPAVRGEMSWTNLDLQPSPYAHQEATFVQGVADVGDVPYAHDDPEDAPPTNTGVSLRDVAYDPFQSTITRQGLVSNGSAREPLRRDRNDLVHERALYQRAHLVSHIYADPDTGCQDYDESVGQTAHDDSLNYRSHAANIVNQELEPHFTARSDRREMMLQTEKRLNLSATSTLGKSSYGNYGL